VTGAGAYHPAISTPRFVESNGMSITNTTGRAELAAITSAILHGHSHTMSSTATQADSLLSIHQIRRHLLDPELHRHRVQGDILKLLVQTVRNSPNLVHLFKFNLTLVLLVMSAQMLWPSIRQHKLIQAMQTQGCHVLASVATPFMIQPGLPS